MLNESEATSGVGDVNLFERGLTTANQNATLRLSDSGSWGKSLFNETRLQITRGSMDITPAFDAVTIVNGRTAAGPRLPAESYARTAKLWSP